MHHQRVTLLLIGMLLLAACAQPPTPAPPTAPPTPVAAAPATPSKPTAEPEPTPPSGLPAAEIINEEGGPGFVTGEWAYTSYAVAGAYQEPVAALLDASRLVQGNHSEWVPRSGQILGTLTSPLSPAPVSYQVNLPIRPDAASVDLDNDGETDDGVLIYALVMSTNLVGDSYLEQTEQLGFSSYLTDPQTGAVREGTFLIYAPNAEQGFPGGAGADGQFFTADDPAVAVPGGYTLATLNPDGSVAFNRSFEARMDVREPAAFASPDFSGQGILESYNALIDVLKVRYSFTELRKLDWEQIRQEYLPRVQAADAAEDFTAYYGALWNLAQSIRDSHVQVTAPQAIRIAELSKRVEPFQGNVGAGLAELSDGRFIATYLDPEGPAARAGWQFGTEIVRVDGVPIGERIDSLPYLSPESTAEGIRVARLSYALSFPVGAEVTIEYRLPGESELRSVTLIAGDHATAPTSSAPPREEISFKRLDDGSGYIQWTAFNDLLYKLAVWEKFLATFHNAPGIVIDLRGNGGGNVGLLNTMSSYLFTDEDPRPLNWIDTYTYDEQANDLVREFSSDYVLSSPKPELTYTGPVVVLVDESSASAAEYFPQLLQRQGRAIVVGEHGSDGAGGVIERVAMPGGLTFQFTKGRSVFAGTDELNLEGKGVTLDVRVPITAESEQAKLDGDDPVLDAALVALADEASRRDAARLTSATWQWIIAFDAAVQQTAITNPADYTLRFGEDGTVTVKADCNQASGTYTRGEAGALSITLGPVTAAECGADSRSDEFIRLLGAATSAQLDGEKLGVLLDPTSDFFALEFEPAE